MLTPDAILQNRYQILRQLGQGGMGEVYQARDNRLGSTVVLKKTFFDQEYLLKAFAGEARLLAHLRHPRLPLVTDFFSEDAGHFLVMQFIPGKDLKELLEERRAEKLGPFPLDQALLWTDQVLDALHYLHSHEPPIVHRDIKPQNLKRTPEGDIMLLDFGLAKGAAAGMSQPMSSIQGYTKEYAPLEQIRGGGTDPRSDLYSLAATLYHLITGKPPADAVTRASAIVSGQPDPVPLANEINAQIPPAVAAALHSALDQNPDRRPASAAAMRRALRQAQEDSPAVMPQTSTVLDEPRSTPVSTWRQTKGLESGIQSSAASPPTMMTTAATLQPPSSVQTYSAQGNQTQASSSPSPRMATRLTIGAVAALIMIIGAIFAYRYWNSARIEDGSNAASAGKHAAPITSTPVEVLRYYLEVTPMRKGGSSPFSMSGAEPLSSEQRFKFHLTSATQGYIYIIAPGEGNVPTTFLTAQPMPETGLRTNLVEANTGFQFPRIQAIKGIGITEDTTFTIIFSPTQLTQPRFLAMPAGRKLTPSEQGDLDTLRKQLGSGTTEASTDGKMVVKVRAGNEAFFFEVLVKHQRSRAK